MFRGRRRFGNRGRGFKKTFRRRNTGRYNMQKSVKFAPGVTRAKLSMVGTICDLAGAANPGAFVTWAQLNTYGRPGGAVFTSGSTKNTLECCIRGNDAKDPTLDANGLAAGKITAANALKLQAYDLRPYGMNEWLRLYRKCYILGSKMTITAQAASETSGGLLIAALAASDKSNAGAIDQVILQDGLGASGNRRQRMKTIFADCIPALAENDTNPVLNWVANTYPHRTAYKPFSISLYASTKGIYGVKSVLGDEQFSSNDVTTVPKPWYFYFKLTTSQETKMVSMVGHFKVTYWCVFSSRRAVDQGTDVPMPP